MRENPHVFLENLELDHFYWRKRLNLCGPNEEIDEYTKGIK